SSPPSHSSLRQISPSKRSRFHRNGPFRARGAAPLRRHSGTGLGTAIPTLPVNATKIASDVTAVIAYLVNPSSPAAKIYSKAAVTAASALGIAVRVVNASTEHELDEAFASLANLGAGGLVVPGEPFFDSQRDRIVALAARHAVPASYTLREYA